MKIRLVMGTDERNRRYADVWINNQFKGRLTHDERVDRWRLKGSTFMGRSLAQAVQVMRDRLEKN